MLHMLLSFIGLARAMASWDPSASSASQLEPDSGYGLLAAGDKISSSQPVPLGRLVGELFFAIWVLLHLYPFLKGLMGRSNRMPTLVIIWALLLAIMSLAPLVEDCVLIPLWVGAGLEGTVPNFTEGHRTCVFVL